MTVSQKLKVSGHTLFSIYDSLLSMGSHYGVIMHEFFILHMCACNIPVCIQAYMDVIQACIYDVCMNIYPT